MIHEIAINTKQKYQMVDITDTIERIVKSSKINEGICFVNQLHTTGALIVNENEDGVVKDIIEFVDALKPKKNYHHNKIDTNGKSHILGSLFSHCKDFIIRNGKLVLGQWQRIFFLELDGPRQSRKIIIKTIGDANAKGF